MIFFCKVLGWLLFFFSFICLHAENKKDEIIIKKKTQKENSSVGLGLFSMFKPAYEGSDEYDIRIFPNLNFKWKDKYFLDAQKGLGRYIIKEKKFELGSSFSYFFGRDEDKSNVLDGLGDIDSGVNFDLFTKYKIKYLSLNLRLKHQIFSNNNGALLNFNVSHPLYVNKKMFINLSLGVDIANQKYVDNFFSITSSQSKKSNLDIFRASKGIKSANVNLRIIKKINKKNSLFLMLGYEYLLGNINESPIVKEKNQYLAGLGYNYNF